MELSKYGLAPLQDYEKEHLERHVHKIDSIEPNQVGRERARFSGRRSSSLRPGFKEKLFLPSSVDNSKLPSFPPIGDQGDLNSCVAWASTYYQASHEMGLLHGWNNKISYEHVLSPKWTYNLINGGKNLGSSPVLAYQLLGSSGAPSILDFPYDQNYESQDLDSEHWISAIFNRMGACSLIPGLGSNLEPQNLIAIKQALNNGHVLTLASFIDSWVFTRIKKDPQRDSSSHVGEYAVSYMNGTLGGHLMTVVGYDDDLWIDINGNGEVDFGERGAFLIANSWGENWGNKGFIWIPYDAFLKNSAVVHGPFENRIGLGAYLNSSLIAVFPKKKNYSPQLVAQITLSESSTKMTDLKIGVSSLEETNPHFSMKIPFIGKGPFAFDLTDLVLSSSPQRYYLIFKSSGAPSDSLLTSFSLLDFIETRKISSITPFSKKTHNELDFFHIDY